MSVKRVFAIIGVVLGGVAAFVGAVLGVMAIMGKFKTPVVKPEKIYFENPEQVIVAQYKDEDNNDVIYSFVLKGENSSYDIDVNVKDCLIWFDNRTGVDLIELCAEDGTPLVADSKGRYKVNCNEKIYYKLKQVDYDIAPDPEMETNGKVVLKARTADELHNSEQDLVIWVDRSVTSVFLKYGTIPNAVTGREQDQTINVGVNSELEFNYVVNPKISLQPISKESAKVVELYYSDPNSEDYVLVNLENIKNTNYNLKNIFDATKTEQTGKLIFNANQITNGNPHEFKIAIFPTYNAKKLYEEYLSTLQGVSEQYSKRLENMIVTNLNIAVVNASVDDVSMSSGSVNLHLYSQNDYIYLNNSDKDNNLNVLMKNDNIATEIRYDEIDFDCMSSSFYGSPVFERDNIQASELNEIDFANYDITYESTSSALTLKEKTSIEQIKATVTHSIVVGKYTIINQIKVNGVDYYCKNGIAFINENSGVKLLNAGSYLNFYTYNAETNTYTQATENDIKYKITKSNSGKDVEWKIVVEYVSQDILNDNTQLVLGLLVANNDEKFYVNKLFATKGVKVNIEDLTYRKLKSSQTLNFVVGSVEKEEYSFETFFEIGGGSYNACVLCIAETDLVNALVEYVEDVYFTSDKTRYYIVGYLDKDNKFVNSVKVKDNKGVTKETKNTLYLLQLTSGFNANTNKQQTAEELITEIYKSKTADPLEIGNEYIQNVIKRETVVVDQNLLIDFSKVTISGSINGNKELVCLYEQSDYILTLESTRDGLITRLKTFYSISNDNIGEFISINYNSNVTITDVGYTENIEEGKDNSSLSLTLSVGDTIFNDPIVTISLVNLANNSTSNQVYSFKIISSAPTNIVYYYDGNDYLTLTDKESAQIPTITAKIGWSEGNYTTTWFMGETELADGILLNNKLSEVKSGFQDPEFKIVHNITYSIVGTGVQIDENVLKVVGTEISYLNVTIAGVNKYLKIEIDTSAFTITEKSNTISGANGVLSALIDYKYNNGTDNTSIYDANLITLSKFTYSHSLDLEFVQDREKFTLQIKDATPIEILVVENKNSDWIFTRVENVYSALSVGFTITTKTNSLDFNLTFEQDVIHEYNSVAWSNPLDDKKIILYQETEILLYEIIDRQTTVFTHEALIKIKNKGNNAISVRAIYNGSDVSVTDSKLTLTNCGDYTVKIYVGPTGNETEIGSHAFTVIPNVVVKQREADALTSNTTYNYNNTDDKAKMPFELKAYPTINWVYGQTKVTINGTQKTLLYSQEHKMTDFNISDSDSITFISTNNMLTKTSSSTNITTGWITKIRDSEEVAVTVTTDNYTVGSFKAVVKNNYKVEINSDVKIENNVLNIKAMTDINSWLQVTDIANFTITNTNWKYSTANENKVTEHENTTIIPESNITYNNVTLMLTFTGTVGSETKTLTFEGKNIDGLENLTINIIPYELENSTIKAYSNNNFNLLTGVYSNTDINNYYQSITVNSVTDENGNSLTNSNLGNVDLTNGLNITFNNIVGDSVPAYINYSVVYKGGTTYTYTKVITLYNYEEFTVNYPENIKSASTSTTDYIYENVMFKEYISGNPILLDISNFEPVLINVNKSATISLLDYNTKFINRIQAKNRVNSENIDVNISSIELYAYQDALYMNAYTKIVSINKTTKTITLPNYSNELSGILVFKISSNSGNYAYYYVNVYSSGTRVVADASKTGYVNVEIASDNQTTIKDFLSNSETKFNLDQKSFKDLFGVELDNVNVYLLNATILADNNTQYQNDVLKQPTVAASSTTETSLRYTCVDNYVLNITDYTTITLSLVYQDAFNIYPVGVVTIYARPKDALSTITGYTNQTENVYNGVYTYEIGANTNSISAPTDFTIKKVYQDSDCLIEYTGGILTKDTNPITLNSKVTEDFVFTVFYQKDDLTLKAIYTYKAVAIPTTNVETVGSLVIEETEDNTKFNNILTFSGDIFTKYFGTYQGTVTIGGVKFTIDSEDKISTTDTTNSITDKNEKTISYKIDNGILEFAFTQNTSQNIQNVDFVFDEAKVNNNPVTITHTFIVKSGIEIVAQSTGDSGTSSALRKTSTLTYNTSSTSGSIIEIAQATTGDGVKYVFGGYAIYINNASGSLTFNFNTDASNGYADSSYITNTLTSGKLTITAGGNLNFVHLAKEKDLNVSFTISNGTSNFQVNGEDITRTFYIKLAKTYTEVESVYVTKPQTVDDVTYTPTAENVEKGSTINKLGENLFASKTVGDYLNATKVVVYIIGTDGKPKVVETVFSNMGFLNSANPNFINFNLADGSKATLTRNDDNSQNITFSSNITKNESCVVYMSNSAGMPTKTYQFNIMADGSKDGITFSTDGYVDEEKTYMSFVVNNDTDKTQAYTTGELKIGSINDNLGAGVFVINGSTVKFLHKNGAVGSSYNITSGSYNYDIILKTDESDATKYNIYLRYNRNANVACLSEKTEISLQIYGSTDFILNTFNVVLFNVDISSKIEGRDTSIYGGDKINLLSKFFTQKEDGKYNMPEGLTFELDEEKSMYGSINPTIKLSENSNLISFDSTKNEIKTETVGSAVKIDAVFKVKIGEVYIKDVTYQFQLNRSLQFSFNGDINETPEEVYEYITNFALTNANDASNTFGSITISFGSPTAETKDIYTDLHWSITDILGSSVIAGISKNSNYINPDDNIVLVSQTGVTFLRDYTGELNLLMKVELINGFNYSVNWKINVHGILTINPQITYNNNYLTQTGIAFNSGNKVSLTNSSDSTGLGLKIIQTNTDNVNYETLKATYSYAIIEQNIYDGKTNQERFDDGAKSAEKTHVYSSSSKQLELSLPVVPSTTNSLDKYLVIYKISLTYLDYTTQDYYIAYQVVNNLDITVATETDETTTYRGDIVNVDNGLNIDKYLVLFNYIEKYKDTEDTQYTITYKNDDYYAGENKLSNVTISNNTITAKIGDATEQTTLIKQENETISYYWNYENKILSVFDLNFVDISEYKAFINSIGYIKIGNFYFELEYIENVGYGIDLTTKYTEFKITDTCSTGFADENKAGENVVLFSNVMEDQDLIIASSDGQPIYTLSHYSATEQKGFKLYADISLKAKGGKKISELFVSSNVTGYTTVKDYVVVGVYGSTGTTSVQTSWVTTNNGTGTVQTTDAAINVEGVTISVPTGTGDSLTYTLQSVKYTLADDGNNIYSIEDTFYVIHSSGAAAIYRMNANKNNVVSYKQDTNTVVDLSTMFIKFINDETNGLITDNSATVSVINEVSSTGIGGILSENTLTIKEENLITYKNANSTASYVTVTYSVTFADQALQCEITFGLPANSTT